MVPRAWATRVTMRRLSGNRHAAYTNDLAAIADVLRQLPERFLLAVGVDDPPERVAALHAARQRQPMAQRAVEAAPRGERVRALVGGVLVAEEERRHAVKAVATPGPPVSGISLNP